MPPNRATAYCPECDMKVVLDKAPKIGLIVVCNACGTTLEVVQLSPLELDWALEDAFEEDDAYYEYDDEDMMLDEYEDY